MKSSKPSRKVSSVSTRILVGSVAALIGHFSASSAKAAILYWDLNGATANTAVAATGNWDGTTSNWNTAATGTGGTAQAGTTAADDLFFSSGSSYTTGTITLSATRLAHSLSFDDNIALTLSGGSLTLGSATAGSGIFALSTANSANTISSAITLAGASTIQNAGTGVLSITGGITGAFNLTLQNNGATANGVTISGASLNNTGTVTNSGTAAGNTLISAIIGANVTGVTQNSATSALTLSGVNAYTSSTTVTSGILRATTSVQALGTGAATLSLGGGTLQLANDTGLNFARNTTVTATSTITADRLTSAATSTTHTLGTLSIGAQTLNITRGTNITGAGVGGITFGAVTLTGAATFAPAANTLLTLGGTTGLGANTLTKSGVGSMTLTGVVSGSKAVGSTAITISDGVLTASNAGNTFTGNIAVDGSGVFSMVGNTFTAAAPYGTVAGGTAYKQLLLTNGGTFRLTSGTFNDNAVSATNLAGGIIFNIGAGGGTLDIASGATLVIDDGTGTGTATTASQLQGSGNILKTGLGILQQDDSTAYAGTITVAAGLLQPASVNAFGSSSAGTIIQSGAALNFAAALVMTNAEPLTLSGTGLASAPAGALTAAVAGTWVGPITIASGGATIGGGAAALTLSSAATIDGTAGNTTVATGAGTLTLNGAVNIGSNTLTMSQGAGRTTFNVTAVISGTGSVVVNGTGLAGDWANNSANTYSGGTTLNAGSQSVVGIGSVGVGGSVTSGNYGTGTLILNGGSIRGGTGGPFTVGNNVTLQADTTFFSVASEKSLIFAGPVTITGASRTINSAVGTTVAGTIVEFSGAIGDGSNTLGLTKTGAGNLKLSGTNTYTGVTSSTGGNLYITGSLANNGGLSIAPSAAAGVFVSFVNNAANTPANFNSLSLGSATGTSFIGLDLGTASDTIATSAAATATNAIAFTLNAATGFGAGNYNLITAASGLTSGSPTYSLNSAPGGYTYGFTNTDGQVQLNVSAATASSRYWRGNVNNSWSAFSGLSTTNWATDAAGTVGSASTPGVGETVFFSASNATGPTFSTTLDNNFTINDLQFTAAPTGVSTVTIAAGTAISGSNSNTLAIAPSSSSAGITLAQGSGAVTISAPVVLGSSQTWSVDSSAPGSGTASSLTVGGAMSGSAGAGVTFTTTAGTAPIILSAVGSTYSGDSTVSASTIVQGGATNAFSPNTGWTVNGTLNTGAFSQATGSLVGGSGIVQNGSATNATLTIGSDNVATATFGGTIQNGSTGTLGITKTGTGTQILSGTNTYTGTTTVTAGTLQIANSLAYSATSALVVNGTGIFDLFGNSLTAASLAGGAATGTITNSSTGIGASTAMTPGTPSGAGIYVDALTGTAAGNLPTAIVTDGGTRKTQIVINNANSGTVFAGLTAATLNTYSGGLVLANNATGTRLVINAAITGTPFGTGPIIIGQSATDKAGIYFSTAANTTLANPIVFNTALGTDRVGIRTDVAGITLSGVITANLAPATFTANTATAGSFNLTNQVTGSNGLVLDITSLAASATSFNVTLNNGTANPNNYQGDTVINLNAATGKSATLNLGATNQIPNGTGTGTVIINSNGTGIGTLNLAGFSDTINGLSGNGTVDGTSGTPTLTVGDNDATANFSGIIKNTAGTLGVTKTGTGTQTLSGPNTFSGAVNVNGGTLAFDAANNLGDATASNTIGINGGTLSYTGAGALSLVANQVVTLGTSHGTINTSNGAGALTLIGGVTAANNNLTKTGLGSLILAATSNLGTGAVAVDAGALIVNNSLTASATTVASAATLGGIGTLTSAVTISSGAMLSPATGTTAGTLIIGSLTLNAGSLLAYEFGGTPLTNDLVAVTTANGLTLNGGALSLYAAGGVTPLITNGTYDLFTYSTGFGGSLANLTVSNSQGGKTYAINDTGSVIQLLLGTATSSDWSGTIDGLWTNDGVGNNWNGGAQPNSLGAVANFGNLAATPQTVTLNGGKTVGSILFDNANTFTIGTNTDAITLDNGIAAGAISATTGSHTINAPITLNVSANVAPGAGTTITFGGIISGTNKSLTFSGAGTSVLNAANTYTGGTTLSNGTLKLGNDSALGSGALTIGAGTTIDNTKGSLLTIANNNAQNWNGSFTFTGTESMDLGNGAVTLGTTPTITTSNAATTLTVGGVIGDGVFSLGITKAGNGTLVLSGMSTYNGATSITAGTLSLTGSLTGGGAISTSGTGILSQSAAGVISGATTVTQGSSGTSVLAGNNPYTGATSITAGTLSLTGSLTGGGAISVSGGTLSLTGSLTGGGAISTSGTGILSQSAAGVISGASTVTQGSSGTSVLAGTNTYTGLTTISGGVLRITNGSALGTTASGTTQSGSSALELDGTGGAITVGAEALTINGGGITNFGALRNIAGDNTYGGTVTLAAQTRINSDSGTLTLSNATAVTGATRNLVVGGAGNITISGAIATTTGFVSKDGAGTLTLSGTNTYTGNTTINAGTLNITGSLTGLAASTNLAYGTTAGNTIVNISGSGSVNNYKNFTGANVAGSIAVMNQTGGSASTLGTGGSDTQWVAQNGGYGYLNITGGTFNTGRFDGVGVTGGGTAIVYVGGAGTFNNNSSDWLILARNSGIGQLTVGPGGSLVRTAAVTANLGITMDASNAHGALNIAGGTVDTGVRPINFGFGSAAFTGTRGFVNLAGGTLSVGSAILQTNTNAGGQYFEHFNFGGGTLKSNAAITWLPATSAAGHNITATIYGAVTNNNNANTAFNTQIGTTSNFGGGLTVDTNGFATTIAYPLSGATGFGVTQGDIGDVSLLAGNSGYIGAPAVVFSAPSSSTGVPASGYAVIDTITGKVTGIIITNPGTYASGEAPTITLTGGGGSIAPITTPVLATANTSGGLTKIGADSLILSGTNTYTGATTISAGTLQLGAAGTTGTLSASSAITNNGTFAINRTNAVAQGTDFSGAAITGTGGLTQAGTGTTTLTAANTFNGATLISAGTLQLGNGTTDGSISNTSSVTNNGTLTFNRVGNFSGSYPISGTGVVNKLGAGTQTLSGALTYTGATNVTAGALTFDSSSSFITSVAAGILTVNGSGAVMNIAGTYNVPNGNNNAYFQVQGGGVLNFSGNATLTNAATGAGIRIGEASAGTMNMTAGTLTANLNFGSNFVVGRTAGGNGTLNVSGGTLTVNSTGTGTGVTTLLLGNTVGNSGVVTVSGTGNLVVTSTASLQMGPGTSTINLNTGGTFTLGGGATASGTSTINFDGGILKAGLSSTTFLPPPLTAANILANGAIIDTNGNDVGIVNVLLHDSGLGASPDGGLTKQGAGTLTLTAASTYTGTTTISVGTLQLGNGTTGNDGTIANSLSIVNNASLVYNRFGSASYGGVISGTGTVTKTGAGTQTLTGTNTYGGTTTVSAGTLTLSGTGAINGSSGITVSGSGAKLLQTSSVAITPTVTLTQGTLTGSGTVNTVNVGDATGGIISNNNGVEGAALTIGALTFNGAATVNTFSGSTSAAIVTTSLATNAAGTVTINPTATNWINGLTYTLISYGGGSIGGAGFGQFVLGPVTGLSGRQVASSLTNTGNAALTIDITGDTPYWVGDGDGKWNLASTNNWKLLSNNSVTTFLVDDDTLFNDNASGAGPITVDIDTANVAPNSTTFDNSTKDYVLNGAFGISTGPLTKTGTGTVTINTANTYTGATTISNGTVSLAGSLGSTAISVGASGTLTETSTGVIGGSASLTTSGSVTLGGNNTYTGATLINAGTLRVGTGSTTGSIANTSGVTNNAALIYNRSDALTAAYVIGGTGTLEKLGAGTLTLTKTNTYSGTTTISAGTLQLGDGTTGNDGTIDNSPSIVNNAALAYNLFGTASYSGSIGGTGSVTKLGAGTQTLSGPNSYVGGTIVNAGTLLISGSGTLGTGSALTLGGGHLDLGTTSQTVGAVSVTTAAASGDTIGNGSLTGTSYAVSNTTGTAVISANLLVNGGAGFAKSGAGTVTLSGTNTFTGATTVTGGTLRLENTSALASTASITLNTANTRVELGTDSAFTTLPGGTGGSTLTHTFVSDRATAGAALNHQLGTMNFGSSTFNFIQGSNVTSGTAGVTFASATMTSGSAGTAVLNPTSATLTITGGVTSSTTNVARTLQLDGTGTGHSIGGVITQSVASALSLVKSNTSSWTLSGLSSTAANNYSGATTIDQGTLALSSAGTVALTGALTFGSAAGGTNTGSLDLSDASATFTGLATVQKNSATANTITVGGSKTLTLNGGLTVGYDASVTGGTVATTSKLTASGAGSIAINGTTITIGVNSTGTNQAFWNDATLDVSGLAAFSTNVTNFNIGVGTTTQGPGTVLLSNTANTIITTGLKLGDTGGNNGRGPGTLILGTGTNVVQADTIEIGKGKGTAISGSIVKFASQTAGSQGTVTIGNKAGTGAANITIANVNAVGTAGGSIATLDLRGHVATVNAGTLLVGQTNAATSVAGTNGTISFDAGTFTVATLTMAPKTAASTGTATATLNVGGGAFTVNTAFTLGSQATAGASVATLNLTGGTFTSNANITQGGGSTTSTINLDGGTLDLTNHSIGGANAIALNAKQGTLKNLATLNSGGTLTKSTTGTLILTGTNGYVGLTDVTNGVVRVQSATGLGTTAGATSVTGGANLQIENVNVGAENLTLNGTGLAGEGALSATGTAAVSGTVLLASDSTVGVATLGDTLTLSGAISGTGVSGLTKVGNGRLTLSGSNLFTGTTNVDSGTLEISGSISGQVALNDGTLTGNSTSGTTGRISGLATLSGGTVNPGAATGTASGQLLMNGGLTFSGASAVFNLNGTTAGTGYDQLAVTGAVSLSANVPFTISLGFVAMPGDAFVLVNNDDVDAVAGGFKFSYAGTPLNEADHFFNGLEEYSISYVGGTGNDITATFVVPEPTSAALLLGGLAMLAGRRRRRA